MAKYVVEWYPISKEHKHQITYPKNKSKTRKKQLKLLDYTNAVNNINLFLLKQKNN